MKLRHLLFIFAICCSCKRSAPPTDTLNAGAITEGDYTCYPIKNNRIAVDLDKPQKVSLFDYFSRIELIPLETNETVLVGSLHKIIEHQNNYYILDRRGQNCVFVFD